MIHDALVRDCSGKSPRLNRSIPYVPIFNKTPASSTDPAVGASTCASGSHVCRGNKGTFTANATKNPRKSHGAALVKPSTRPLRIASWIAVKSKLPTFA